MSSIVGTTKTQIAVTSNSTVTIHRNVTQQAPSIRVPTVPSLPIAKKEKLAAPVQKPATIAAGPVSVSKSGSANTKLTPLKMPSNTAIVTPVSSTLSTTSTPTASTPTNPFNRSNSTSSVVKGAGKTPGTFLSGVKSKDVSGKKAPVTASPTMNGKDKISFGMVDDSLLSKSMPAPKPGN